ncbi:hypothetical protein HYDPIDRAFT_111084 [Hydnomerulius pinastri MD-312]|uniref:Uncharacterized protein n=1 Tax=Hydnomerulius pinastri MD-312 TaxID=994086 RepID=A0A0C9W2H6_9AGAM|nr:hypothetical protein HYDPIDRAFT_111084 [Hydnomerulius pinastri MD-312]
MTQTSLAFILSLDAPRDGHDVIVSISQSVRNSDQSDFIQPAIRKVMEDIGIVQP